MTSAHQANSVLCTNCSSTGRPQLPCITLPGNTFAETASLKTLRSLITRLRSSLPSSLPLVLEPHSLPIPTTSMACQVCVPVPIEVAPKCVPHWEPPSPTLFSCIFDPLRTMLHSLIKEVSPYLSSPTKAPTQHIPAAVPSMY